MFSLRLYESYSSAAIAKAMASSVEQFPLGNDAWFCADGTIVGLITLGTSQEQTQLKHCRAIRWICPHGPPKHLGRFDFVPPQVRRAQPHQVHLFLRNDANRQFIYVGACRKFRGLGRTNAGHGWAEFELRHAIPSNTWNQLGGRNAHPLSFEFPLPDKPLDLADPKECLERIRQFAEAWHGPLSSEDGLCEEEMPPEPLPELLANWYRIAGRRLHLLGHPARNYFLPAQELLREESRLVFYVEPEANYLWAIDLADPAPDPVVWLYKEPSQTWEREQVRLSTFLLQIAYLQAIHSAPYHGQASFVPAEWANEFDQLFPRLPLGPWSWPVYPTRFHGRPGALALVSFSGEEEFDVWVGANSDTAIAQLRDLPIEWDVAWF